MPKLRLFSFEEAEEERRVKKGYTLDKLLEFGMNNIQVLKKSDEWNRQNLPSKSYIARRFGSWGNFKRAVYSKKRGQISKEQSKTEKTIIPSWVKSGLSQVEPENREEFLKIVDENLSDISWRGIPKLITIRQWDSGKRIRELFSELNTLHVCSFLSIMYHKRYWNAPLKMRHKNQSHTSLRRFASNYDPISGENLGLNKGVYAALIGRYTRYLKQTDQNLSFVEFMTRNLSSSLTERIRKLDDGTRLKEYCVERYILSFWNNPLPEFKMVHCWKSRPLSKSLASFVVSWDHIKGTHAPKCSEFRSLRHDYDTHPEIKNKISFFDYMTQGLNPELVEKARLIDSGERAKQLLVERIKYHNQNLEGYVHES